MRTYYLCLDNAAADLIKKAALWISPRVKSNLGQIVLGAEDEETVFPLSEFSGSPFSLSGLLVTEDAKIAGTLLRRLNVAFDQIVGFDDLVRYVDGVAAETTLQGTAARHHLVYRESGDLVERFRMMRWLSIFYLHQVPPREVAIISHTEHLYLDPVIEINTEALKTAQAEFEEAAREESLPMEQVGATMGRLKRLIGLAAENRGRLPVYLNYLGAITGRFSAGGGLNFQGIPRSLPQQHAAIQRVNTAIRSALQASKGFRFLSADASAMEPRIMAWLANDGWMKQVFDHDRSLYDEFGRSIFNIPLSDPLNEAQHRLAKIMFIGLQYGASAFRLWKMLQEQLSEEDRDSLLGPPETQRRCCYRAVQCFREVCPNLVRIRREYWNAFIAARREERTTFERVTFVPQDDGVAITLPSGRKVLYNSVTAGATQLRSFQKITPGGCIEECELEVRPTTYLGIDGKREPIYEAKLLQNIVQAIGRDLLAEMILRAESAGIRVVGHIHDEVVALVKEDDVARAEAILKSGSLLLPEWATGMSLVTKTAVGQTFEEL